MPDANETSIDALSVAYLAAQGKTQIEISRILGLSQSVVSRHYSAVKDKYIKTVFLEDQVKPDTLQEIQRRTSGHGLQDRLQKLAWKHGQEGPQVHSVFLPEDHQGNPNFEMFAPRAAPFVYNLLKQARKTVGVAWGSTLWHTTQHLRTFVEAPWRKDLPIEFIPLCGDPLVDSLVAKRYADRTSSRIASELSKIVNGDELRSVWLGLVPAYIPRTFDKYQREVIDRFIDLSPHYGRIFGPRDGSTPAERPLAEDLDMILTAAGSSEYPGRVWKRPASPTRGQRGEGTGQAYSRRYWGRPGSEDRSGPREHRLRPPARQGVDRPLDGVENGPPEDLRPAGLCRSWGSGKKARSNPAGLSRRPGGCCLSSRARRCGQPSDCGIPAGSCHHEETCPLSGPSDQPSPPRH